MPTTRDFPLERLHAERDAGLLICHCHRPILEPLPLWDRTQCARCGRLFLVPQ